MGFLAPWFLAGIVAVGVPLWLHLLRQYRSEPQPFSSLMFFEPRTQSSILHRRLRYLVLLALRVALLALMALAFANPFVNQTAVLAGGKKLVVIAVDRSFSMRYGDRMERAKEEAKKVVASMRGGEQGHIAAVDSGVQLLTQPTND
ncbi:MAG: BatA domain-containing protein, partial [Bryobacteraceae bacterium]